MSHALYPTVSVKLMLHGYTDVQQKSKAPSSPLHACLVRKSPVQPVVPSALQSPALQKSIYITFARVCTKGRGFGRHHKQPKSAHHKCSLLILGQVAQLPNCRICLVDISLHICQPCARLNRQRVKTPQEI